MDQEAAANTQTFLSKFLTQAIVTVVVKAMYYMIKYAKPAKRSMSTEELGVCAPPPSGQDY